MKQKINFRTKSLVVFLAVSLISFFCHTIFLSNMVDFSSFLTLPGFRVFKEQIFFALIYGLAAVFLLRRKNWAWLLAALPPALILFMLVKGMVAYASMGEGVPLILWVESVFPVILLAYSVASFAAGIKKFENRIFDLAMGIGLIIFSFLSLTKWTDLVYPGFLMPGLILSGLVMLLIYAGAVVLWEIIEKRV